MRFSLHCCLLLVGAAGCLDLSALQSGGSGSQDMAMQVPMDMAMSPVDLARDQSVVVIPDLTPTPDLSTPVEWTKVYSSSMAPLYAISGMAGSSGGADSIFAVGKNGTVVQGADSSFTKVASPTGSPDLHALWVAGAKDLWVAGSAGQAQHSTDAGASWLAPVASTNLSFKLLGIFGKGTSDIIVAGEDNNNGAAWNGSLWSAIAHNNTNFVLGIWASPNSYYVVGMGGRSSKSSMASGSWTPIKNIANDLNAISGLDDNNIWSVTSSGQIVTYNAGMNKWTQVVSVAGSPVLNALWVKSAAEVWIAGVNGGNGYVAQCDLAAGSPSCTSKGNSNLNGVTLTGIWGNGTGAIWASATQGTDGAIFKY